MSWDCDSYQDADDNKCFVCHGMIDSIPSSGLLHSRQVQFVQAVPGADFSLNRKYLEIEKYFSALN